jgi:hypothetical protein
MVLIRYSAELEALDTLTIPRDNVERAYFELSGDGRFMRAGVPYQPNLQWRFTPDGFATVETGAYRIERLSWTHDTLVTITKAYTPLSVTDQDIEQAVADLEWFTRQGGQIEYDKFPDQKPASMISGTSGPRPSPERRTSVGCLMSSILKGATWVA